MNPAQYDTGKPGRVRDLIDRSLIPYLQKKHPNARLIMLSGSYGRAMNGDIHAPLPTSDLDVLVVYDKIEDAGLKCATRQYDYIEAAPYPGGPTRKIMIDMNVQDYESLQFQKDLQINVWRNLFSLNMIADGYAIRDDDNRAEDLKRDAQKTIARGPAPLTQREARYRMGRLAQLANALAVAPTSAERKLIGLLAIRPAANLLLNLTGKWNSSVYQTNRYLEKYAPEQKTPFYDAFKALFEYDDPKPVLAVLKSLQDKTREKLPTLPLKIRSKGKAASLPTALPPDTRKKLEGDVVRFVLRHFCDSLDTAERRGYENYIDTLSATLSYMLKDAGRNRGDLTQDISHNIDRVEQDYPGLRAAFLNAFQTRRHGPIRQLAEDLLKDRGGLDFEQLQIDFPADRARRNMKNQQDKRRKRTAYGPTRKRHFRP